jgi:hypothetical protein
MLIGSRSRNSVGKPMRFLSWLIPSLALLFGSPLAGQPVPVGDARILMEPAPLKAHMSFLADDLLEGREAGTRGDRLTQLYVAARFAAAGLQPAGDGGGYLQRFRVRSARLDVSSVSFDVHRGGRSKRFANGETVLVFADMLEASQRIENAPLVFAGYGIVAPERGIDDYRQLDVRGKVVVVLGGPPPFLPSAEGAHYGSADQQRITADERGAIGVIQLWTPALEQRAAFRDQSRRLNKIDLAWIGPDGRPNVLAPAVRLRAVANGAATDEILAGGRATIAQLLAEARTGSPRGFALPARISLARRSIHDAGLQSANVAGLLPGSDPALADEVVVLTAHHDHIGIGAPVKGDAIYNGALDNAVGVSMLIEVARSIAASHERPRRSILFLAVAAEEKGLIGSDYFAARPTVRPDAMVANINLDGAFPFYDFRDVIAFGADQSQLIERLTVAAGQLGLTVAPDPFPEEGIFTRSDQYSFVKRGIPAVFLYNGFTNLAGRNVGRAVWDDLLARVVHEPGDDLSQPIDYRSVAKFADVFRRLTLVVADTTDRPFWYQDSIFAKRFAPRAATAKRPRAPHGAKR